MALLSFAFWNTNRKQDPAVIAELAAGNGHAADVLLLAECSIHEINLLPAVNSGRLPIMHLAWRHKGLVLMTRFLRQFVTEVNEHPRYTFCTLELPARPALTMACAHLRDPVNNSIGSRTAACYEFAGKLRDYEERVGHRRSVVLGDLNLNPHDDAVVAANGLHAIMSRGIASQECRTVDGRDWPYLYNVMWSRFGDDTTGPPATHYFRRNEHVCQFWHMYDQVLVRPELLSYFADDDVTVVRELGGRSLASSPVGNPDNNYSDHFPITFRLSI